MPAPRGAAAYPGRIGALDGLPTVDRDAANTMALRSMIGEHVNTMATLPRTRRGSSTLRHVTGSRRLKPAMAAAVVLVLFCGYLGVVLSYRLEFGGDGQRRRRSGIRRARAASRGSASFTRGAATRIAIAVRNPGKLTVTVEAVAPYGPDIIVDELRVIERGRDISCGCLFEGARPLHPTKSHPAPRSSSG